MSTVADMTTTEHPTPEPDGDEQRAAFIAGMHAFADWLAAHPDVPTPRDVEVTFMDHGDPVESKAKAEHLVAQYGARKSSHGGTRWVTLRPDVGINATYVMYVADEKKRDQW